MLHKATIAGLTMDPASNTPIIILKIDASDKAVPIWIGLLEATAIASVTAEETFAIDSRPSDAIAIALRFQAPIFVDDRVIEKSATDGDSGEAQDKSEEGRKWAEYLKNLSPEHFGKYKV